ncbi:M15 family metallopeptidase [Sulfurimonas sp.]|uniref:M15 family metallopeptidase n=1 Tax=Sulfurimonas sp. TaxID=2022749 RepID=UPI002B468F34|nr:M15 family metallopeptidase [Sulfurimonas sp.]
MLSKLFTLVLLLTNACASNDLNTKAQEIESKFLKAKLTRLSDIDSSIKVNLVNSNTDNNFFKMNFYGNLNECYLQKKIIYKLKKAQAFLKKSNPNLSLLLMDCARPRSVSWQMYNKLKGTPFEKYVANPATGSMHNYGSAVDITLINANGSHLDMGMNPFYKNRFELLYAVTKNKLFPSLSKEQSKNRLLLKSVMEKAGFKSIKLEWWHFNGFLKKTIRKKYKIIE